MCPKGKFVAVGFFRMVEDDQHLIIWHLSRMHESRWQIGGRVGDCPEVTRRSPLCCQVEFSVAGGDFSSGLWMWQGRGLRLGGCLRRK